MADGQEAGWHLLPWAHSSFCVVENWGVEHIEFVAVVGVGIAVVVDVAEVVFAVAAVAGGGGGAAVAAAGADNVEPFHHA